ncbi:MAG: DNA primase [Gammaproteobacteria bacterium]|nr:DNA primase [Gammaproteobacteria bacterium]
MAGRIPQSFINDMLARVDIVDVIQSRMTLKKAGKNYSGLCPFHDEKTPSFSVSPDKQFFHCFGCQESGTALTFIMNFDRLEFVEAVESLAQQLGLEVQREAGRGPPRPQVDPDLYAVLEKAEQFYRYSLRKQPVAVDYLKSRGLTGVVARDFGIGYAPPGWQNLQEYLKTPKGSPQLLDAGLTIESDSGRAYDRFRDRIMFPIRDTRGRVIGFGGRTLGAEEGPKYLNSPETPVFHKGSELYGLYEARRALRRIDRLIVVEGYMDVVALAQHGVANSVATLGTASGEAHFQKLYRYADEVVCCFDGDQAGRAAAWKALENALPTLNEHRLIKVVFLPDGEDPDSLIRSQGKAGFLRFIDNAMPGLEFLFQRLSQGLDLSSVDGRARLAGLVAPYLNKVPEGYLRTLLEQKLRELTGLDARASSARRMPTDVRSTLNNRTQKVSDRLLTLLLKQPEIWLKVDAADRSRLFLHRGDLGLLGELASYIDTHPEADIEEILVHWSDEPSYEELLQRAQTVLEIESGVILGEFKEGVVRLTEILEQQARRRALTALKENPDVEGLRQFMALRKP